MNINVKEYNLADSIEPVGNPDFFMRSSGRITKHCQSYYQSWEEIKKEYTSYKFYNMTLERHQLLSDGNIVIDFMPSCEQGENEKWLSSPHWEIETFKVRTRTEAALHKDLRPEYNKMNHHKYIKHPECIEKERVGKERVGKPGFIMRTLSPIENWKKWKGHSFSGRYQSWDKIRSAYEISGLPQKTLERHQNLADGRVVIDSMPTMNSNGIWSSLPTWPVENARICTREEALFHSDFRPGVEIPWSDIKLLQTAEQVKASHTHTEAETDVILHEAFSKNDYNQDDEVIPENPATDEITPDM